MENSSDDRIPSSNRMMTPPHLTARRVLTEFAYTAGFCAAIAITLWLLDLASPLWGSFLVSFSIGFSIHTSSLLARVLVPFMPSSWLPLPTTLVGLGIGLVLAGTLALGNPWFFFSEDYSALILGLFFGVVGFLFFSTRQKLSETRAQLAQSRATQLDREKQHLATQLRLLQAQIEPHFLFNTLSNIAGMIHTSPKQAEKTLVDLTTLLRATLRRTRVGVATLGDELEILEALLAINKARMGDRLRYTIDIEESLAALPMPPMLLQPLVENAVKHGIDPLEDGGEVRISASRTENRLVVTVADTGIGVMAHSPGGGSGVDGIGLANVQARLAAIFDREARLDLKDNNPRGMIATMHIPIESG